MILFSSQRIKRSISFSTCYNLIIKITIGIASTTHIDLHGERFNLSGLRKMARVINSKFIPIDIEHKQIFIGVILSAKVKELKDKEWGLFIVGGIFENKEEQNLYKYGAKNNVSGKYKNLLNSIQPPQQKSKQKVKVIKSSHEQERITLTKIEKELGKWLDSTQIWVDGSVYKIKALIASIGELKIYVYPKDHNPAHFHVISKQRGINARFELSTLDILSVKKGEIRQSDVKKIKAFFVLRKDLLDFLKNEHKRLNS